MSLTTVRTGCFQGGAKIKYNYLGVNTSYFDSKNRKIGRKKDDTNSGTGAGRHTGTDSTGAGLEYTVANSDFSNKNQSTLGNLYFTATIRIDIIKVYNPNKLQSEPPPMPQFPSRSSGIISFGSPVGFK